jgi:hypothetical protein
MRLPNKDDLVTYGLKGLDGIDYIVRAIVMPDMGDSGRRLPKLKEQFIDHRYGRFHWASKKTGRVIYKEITKDEYHTNG